MRFFVELDRTIKILPTCTHRCDLPRRRRAKVSRCPRLVCWCPIHCWPAVSQLWDSRPERLDAVASFLVNKTSRKFEFRVFPSVFILHRRCLLCGNSSKKKFPKFFVTRKEWITVPESFMPLMSMVTDARRSMLLTWEMSFSLMLSRNTNSSGNLTPLGRGFPGFSFANTLALLLMVRNNAVFLVIQWQRPGLFRQFLRGSNLGPSCNW